MKAVVTWGALGEFQCHTKTLKWGIRSGRLVPWAVGFYTPSFCFPGPAVFLLSGAMCFVGWQILWISQKCCSDRVAKWSSGSYPEMLGRGGKMNSTRISPFFYSTLLVQSDVLLWLPPSDPSVCTGGYRQPFSCLPLAFLLWLQGPCSLLHCPLCLQCCWESAWCVKWECKGGWWSPALC